MFKSCSKKCEDFVLSTSLNVPGNQDVRIHKIGGRRYAVGASPLSAILITSRLYIKRAYINDVRRLYLCSYSTIVVGFKRSITK